MQKLDLGVEYDPESAESAAQVSGQPTTAQPTTTSPNRGAVPQHTTLTQPMKKKSSASSLFLIVAIVAIVAGGATGLGAFKLQAKSDPLLSAEPIQQVATSTVKDGDVFGSTEESIFKDSAEGYLQIGGLEGEGSHHLLREGGADQTVYLVSTVTDLDKFEGMDVKVWGETYKGQKVGWLMDVGRIQVVSTSAQAPAASE